MDTTTLSSELYRIGAAASDLGVLEWVRRFVSAAGLAVVAFRLLDLGRWMQIAVVALVVLGAHAAQAQPLTSEDETNQRLHFLESHLAAEAAQARAWEAGWSVVDVSGVGYGAYQIAQQTNRAELAEGIVGTAKSVIGVVTLAATPLKTARGARELRERSGVSPEERLDQLVVAERLLRQNAAESDIRYAWQAHVISLALNLVGGVVVWIAGDFWKGAQSAAIGAAVGEVQIWTRPWKAKRDLREYRLQFGGMASTGASRPTRLVAAPSVRLSATGLQVAF